MVVEPVGFIVILLTLTALFCGPVFGMYLVLALGLFGATAAVLLPALGGATVQPVYFFIPFFILICFFSKENLRNSLRSIKFPRPAFWLFVLTCYTLLSAYFFPRIFAGATDIFAISRGEGIIIVPLRPVSGNVTQSGYFAVEALYFLALLGALRGREHHFVNAVFFAGCLNVFLAAIDYITFNTGTAHILDFVRNSTYAGAHGIEVAGMKRLTGIYPEASAFVFATTPFFAFFLQLWIRGVRPAASGALAVLCFVTLVMSISSSAYVLLAILVPLAIVQCYSFIAAGTAQMRHVVYSIALPIVSLTVILGLALVPSIWYTVDHIFERMLLNKLSTGSGVERMSWNYQAWENFVDTYGMGAGIGSMRASNFAFGVLGSIGVIGALLYIAFLFSVLRPLGAFFNATAPNPVQQAALFACLSVLLIALLIGVSVSLSVYFLSFAALAVSLSREGRKAPVPAPQAALLRSAPS
ncbi:MAG: hypothetical protein AAGM38_12900 [Pseudomonadota bacterium]